MKISEIQLEMLLERYKRQAGDARRSEYETAQALEELRAHRILGAIPVEGTVR